MTVHFAALDWIVVALFFAAVLALGLSARLKQNSVLQFLAAGRALTLPLFVATLVSTWYGGILGVGEAITTFGIGTWLLLGVPYYIFGLVYALWLAPRVRTEQQLSLPERLELRWGKGVGLVGGCLVLLLALPATQVYMLAVLIRVFTGWPILWCLILGGLTVSGFLLKGGLLADVRVGVLAFLLMFVGFFALDAFAVIRHAPATIVPTLQAHEALHITGGIGPLGVATWFILGAWTLVDPAFHQRVTSSASPAVGRKGVLISVLCWMVFDILSTTAGLYALALLPKVPDDPVALFPAFGDAILPAGLKGLFFIGMAGTIVSALAGYTLVSGVTIGREIAARIKPGLDTTVTAWSRAGLFLASALAIVVALTVPSVVDIWYAYNGAIVGPLLIPVCLAYMAKESRLTPLAISSSMITGCGIAIGWGLYARRTNNPEMNVSFLRETFSLGTLVPAFAVSAAVLGLSVLLRGAKTGDTR